MSHRQAARVFFAFGLVYFSFIIMCSFFFILQHRAEDTAWQSNEA